MKKNENNCVDKKDSLKKGHFGVMVLFKPSNNRPFELILDLKSNKINF